MIALLVERGAHAIAAEVVAQARRAAAIAAVRGVPVVALLEERREQAIATDGVSSAGCVAAVEHGVAAEVEEELVDGFAAPKLRSSRSASVCGHSAPTISRRSSRIAATHQGSGLATEALAAVITELFERHGIHRVFAVLRRAWEHD